MIAAATACAPLHARPPPPGARISHLQLVVGQRRRQRVVRRHVLRHGRARLALCRQALRPPYVLTSLERRRRKKKKKKRRRERCRGPGVAVARGGAAECGHCVAGALPAGAPSHRERERERGEGREKNFQKTDGKKFCSTGGP